MTDKRTIDAAVAYAACCGYDLAEKELADLRAQVAALTAERDALKDEVGEATDQLTRMTAERNHAREELAVLRARLEDTP